MLLMRLVQVFRKEVRLVLGLERGMKKGSSQRVGPLSQEQKKQGQGQEQRLQQGQQQQQEQVKPGQR
jgi:hypothetical protein